MASHARPTALVTGANGFIGNAVARAFVQAGYATYGLIRKADAAPSLASQEITPIIGTPDDLSFIPSLLKHTVAFDVIASVTENVADYIPHFNNITSMVQSLSKTSNEHGVKPFVIFTSGCKDYGQTLLHGDANLTPHTETSPLNPPAALSNRATHATKILSHADSFDAVVTRPTTLFGYSSSFYGPAFDIAARAAATQQPLILTALPESIMHGTHVDDVGSAYVALAKAPRQTVTGQCYNIAAKHYETLREVGEALAKEYGIDKIEYQPNVDWTNFDIVQYLWGFSQWVGSEKIRKDTGWTDVRGKISERIGLYRAAFEEASKSGHDNVARIKAGAERKTL